MEEFGMQSPVYLHAELTWDHFLVTKTGNSWDVSGVIDFADCRVGPPEYEMSTSIAFLFKKNRDAMQKYVQAMGVDLRQDSARFSEKLLAWTALHLFSNLTTYFSKEMAEVNEGDFAALARMVYPL